MACGIHTSAISKSLLPTTSKYYNIPLLQLTGYYNQNDHQSKRRASPITDVICLGAYSHQVMNLNWNSTSSNNMHLAKKEKENEETNRLVKQVTELFYWNSYVFFFYLEKG